MKKLLILSASHLKSDPRIYRQIMALKDQYQITASGYTSPEIDGVDFVPMSQGVGYRGRKRKLLSAFQIFSRQYAAYYWSRDFIEQSRQDLTALEPFDVVLANEVLMLPLGVHLAEKWSAKLVYDAHEYSPRQYEDRLRWRLFFQKYVDWICRAYLPKVDSMMTVCQGLAEAYAEEYGAHAEVVTNAPNFADLQPTPVDPNHIRMVHHGFAIINRRLELMIDMMDSLDERFHLDFMLMPKNPGYLESLMERAAGNPRIRFMPTVPMQELPRACNAYDIGLFLVPPTTFNYRFILPNKFFEFVQGRLAIAIGPSIEMKRLTEQYGMGVVSEDFTPQSLARELNKLSADQITAFKQKTHEAAPMLCAERNTELLTRLVNGTAPVAQRVTQRVT